MLRLVDFCGLILRTYYTFVQMLYLHNLSANKSYRYYISMTELLNKSKYISDLLVHITDRFRFMERKQNI